MNRFGFLAAGCAVSACGLFWACAGSDGERAASSPSGAGPAEQADCSAGACPDEGALDGDSAADEQLLCPELGDGAGLDSPLQEAERPDATVAVHHNHLGFELRGDKRAVVESSEPLTRFQVVRSADRRVFFEGELQQRSFDAWDQAAYVFVADFSELLDEGSFLLRVNGQDFPAFQIGADFLFRETVGDVLSYFRKVRGSAEEVRLEGVVPTQTHMMGGGWHDASGDVSKYLTHLSYANFMNPQQIPLTAWVLAWVHGHAGDRLRALGLESEAQAEALFGADYLVSAQAAAGYFYTNVFDGWTGLDSDRSICAFEGNMGRKTQDWQSAFREGGGLSIAALARISTWGQAGAFSSEEYLAAAESAFAHLQANNTSYCDDGRENIIDDYAALLAATELYAATESATYLAAARSRASALADRIEESGYFVADDGTRPFWHAADAGLPVVALARYLEVEKESAQLEAAKATIRAHLDYLVAVTNEVDNPYGYARQSFEFGGALESGFFIPHDNETGYWYQGESARLGSLAAAATLGGRAIGARGCSYGVSRELSRYATDQIDWILGKNPFDVSLLAGHGRNNPPSYAGSELKAGHHDGGISNGITGRESPTSTALGVSSKADGSGIQWMHATAPTAGQDAWLHWRWIEQWIPHSTWYLMALAAMEPSAALDPVN